ncbi:hypothetical protein C8035_v006170 [Colletotrichum spinosum]|uniref:Uncharacterized protein n=1 Tax=Colletotrichum spinosum TaxID=1347390 RepID=A0A4R8Q4U2_9PEZI|nr:hypothetical protein C8035_v006170 [Colletotrichum spinosum]
MDGSNSPFGSEDNTSLLFSNDHPTVLPATVYEILYNIGQTFSHVQYAITGTAAMMAYGFDDRAPQHISIICPSRSKEVIPSWAAAGGMETSLIEPNIINVTVTGGDVWKIRVLYLDLVEDGFDAFETVHMSFGDDSVLTTVLTMPALINQFATSYKEKWYMGSIQETEAIAGDILWLLDRISVCEDAEHRFPGAWVPAVRDPRFWVPFTRSYKFSAQKFSDAGLWFTDSEYAAVLSLESTWKMAHKIINEPGEGFRRDLARRRLRERKCRRDPRRQRKCQNHVASIRAGALVPKVEADVPNPWPMVQI